MSGQIERLVARLVETEFQHLECMGVPDDVLQQMRRIIQDARTYEELYDVVIVARFDNIEAVQAVEIADDSELARNVFGKAEVVSGTAALDEMKRERVLFLYLFTFPRQVEIAAETTH